MTESATFENRAMPDEPAVAHLIAQVRAGDQDAAAQIFHHFAVRLGIKARRYLGLIGHGRIDPEDVVQSAFKSFFRATAEGTLNPESWPGLWALLTTITMRKCGHKLAYLKAARRDVRREVAPSPTPDLTDPSWEALASEPTPLQGMMLTELVSSIVRELEEGHRGIFLLALQGNTVAEIADQVAVTERTVQRVLKQVRERVESLAQA
jgi:RNA polymerase sigma-70 factor, ECF subfamily